MASEEERAQLWSIYFALRSLKAPPPCLVGTRAALREHLRATRPPSREEAQPAPTPQGKTKRRRPSHLSVIGGGV